MTWRRRLSRFPANPLLRRNIRSAGAARSLALLGGYIGVLVLLLALPVGVSVVRNDPAFPPKEGWRVGYGLSITLHVALLFFAGVGRVMGAMSRERSRNTLQGLLLAPIPPLEMAAGFWLGEAWLFLAASAVLAPATLVAALGAGIPFVDWAGAWVAVLLSAGFLQVLGMVVARTAPKPEKSQGPMILLLMLVMVWPLTAAFYSAFRSAGGVVPTWPYDLLWLTPGPALGVVWGGLSRLQGIGGYLIALGMGSVGTALALLAASRKFHDPDRPALPRRLVLALSGILGLYAGLRLLGQDGEVWYAASLVTVLGWGLISAFLLTPSAAALEAGFWRREGTPPFLGLDERAPGRGALLVCIALLLLGLGGTHAVHPASLYRGGLVLGWLWAAFAVLAFSEILGSCRILLPGRGALAAVLLFIAGNFLPFLAVALFWDRVGHQGMPPCWYTFWGCLSRPPPADVLKGAVTWGLLWGFFMILARWLERQLEARVSRRKAEILSA